MIGLAWKGKETQVNSAKVSCTEDLIAEAVEITRVKANRLRLYYVKDGATLVLRASEKITSGCPKRFEIVDSGPQVGCVVENLCEYVPPIFIWLAIVWMRAVEIDEYIEMTTVMWIIHYVKRSFEVVFVHKFSGGTLPVFSIRDNSALKNGLYYWIFAVAMAFNAAITADGATTLYAPVQDLGVWLFLVSELLNGYCHLCLRLLRSGTSMERDLPRGFFFNHITCPNYTFEILSWIGFAMYSQTITSVFFPICGGGQMFIWAGEKREKLASRWPEAGKRGRITPFRFL